MRLVKKLLPPHSRQRAAVRKVLLRLGVLVDRSSGYDAWMQRQQQYQAIPDELFNAVNQWADKPLISIVIPLYKTQNRYLEPLVYGIIGQQYQNWELVLVDEPHAPEGSSRDRLVSADERIRLVTIPKNKGIAMTTNAGITAARGEFVAFMDHDDLLEPTALFEVAAALYKDASIDLFYSDEGKVTDDGEKYQTPHFKPDWSPDLLRNVNYITHFVVARKSVVLAAGLLDVSRDGAQDYDFLLRVVDKTQRIHHIPRVLYHWRLAQTSTAANFAVKKKVVDAGRQALQDHLDRNHMQATATVLENRPGFYRVIYKDVNPKNSTVALYLDDTYKQGAGRIFVEEYAAYCAETGYQLVANKTFGSAMLDKKQVTTIPADSIGDFLKGVAAAHTKGIVLVVADDVVPASVDDLRDLFAVAAQKHVVSVCPQVISVEAKCVVDMGLVRNNGLLRPLFAGHEPYGNTFFGDTEWVRNISAPSGRVFAVKAEQLPALLHAKPGYYSVVPEALEQLASLEQYHVSWPFSKFTKLQIKGHSLGGTPDFYNQQLSIKAEIMLKNGDRYGYNEND